MINEATTTGNDEMSNNEDEVDGGGATTPISTSSTTKEKRSWFHSLTRRKKSQSQNNTPPTASDVPQSQNNNNEPPEEMPTTSRKRKDEKGVFQRFRRKMGLRFHSLRQRRDDSEGGGTTDASAEFLTKSPIREPQLMFNFTRLDQPEMVPFTQDYKRFIAKKWLERDSNRVMYKACSEMLSQVWYWGEISRKSAQKQLTDKPTGSFLVRDSETSGSSFTLSFRIANVTLHYRLEYRDNYWHFEELQYESIVEMIEDILYRCTNDNFVCFVKVPNEMQPPFPVILKYPLSRYLKMPHLQDLCRRIIQQNAQPDEIAKLPIPTKLLEYLDEKRELVFQS